MDNSLKNLKEMYTAALALKHKKTISLLTEREKELIQQISKGLSTKEIAKEMNISFHTVESHRTNIFSKLDVNSSAELVALAFRIGLIN